MGKITVEISDEIEMQIRKYIANKYWKNPKGKLSAIIEEALKKWMAEAGAEAPAKIKVETEK